MDVQRQTNSLSQYDEMALRHNAAYAAFRSIYETKYPPPVHNAVERDSLFVPITLVVMILASVVVSGSRTIIEFGGGIVGAAAFTMLEGAIVAYAFFRTRTNFTESRIENVRRLANVGLALAFAVAAAANVHAVLKASGIMIGDWVNTGILLLISLSAPTLAFISGDILALETMKNTTRWRRADRDHQEATATWHTALNEAWAREKSRWGVRVEIPMESNGFPLEKGAVPVLPSASTLGHHKQPQASKIVRDYYAEHPEALQWNPLEVARLLKVGKSTVYAIRQELAGDG